MNPECIITGCDLYVLDEGKSLHGDLWRLGTDTYIFNGVLDQEPFSGEAAWQHGNSLTMATLMEAPDNFLLVIGQYFERRGVVVVSFRDADLNRAARDYISRRPG